MMPFFLVAFGGAAGSVLRYAVQRWLNTPALSWGTLAVNLAGCFAIGCFWALLSRSTDEPKRLLLMTGLCGGFTTFSSFTLDGIALLTAGRWAPFFIYTFASVAGGLLATFTGYKLFTT